MDYKWFGAILVVAGCGGFGFSLAAEAVRQEKLLRALLDSLDFMQWELSCRLTPLPQLLELTAQRQTGRLRRVYRNLASQLEGHTEPRVDNCMRNVLEGEQTLPGSARRVLVHLGKSLGRFDLAGQLKGLASAQSLCRRELQSLEHGRDMRLRSYRTLGLCAGVALAVLLI